MALGAWQNHNPSEWSESGGGHKTVRLMFPHFNGPPLPPNCTICWVWACEDCGKSRPYGGDGHNGLDDMPCGFVDYGEGI